MFIIKLFFHKKHMQIEKFQKWIFRIHKFQFYAAFIKKRANSENIHEAKKMLVT